MAKRRKALATKGKSYNFAAHMREATRGDKELVSKILYDCFYDNNSVLYTTKKNNVRAVKKLMEYSFDICFNCGYILINDAGTGCLLVKNPEKKLSFIYENYLNIKLIFQSIGLNKVKRVLDRERKIKQTYRDKSYIYLWYIGVSPNKQGKGQGTELLNHLINISKKNQLPIYLETSVDKNVDWYLHHGFKLNDTIPFDVNLYSMVRQPLSGN